MSDFKHDLRRYIDGLEKPVSVQETMNRGNAPRPSRIPVAILAGAAVVLIPALVLIGLRLLPGQQDDVTGTTAPSISETTSVDTTTTSTTAAPAAMVEVPDLVGLSEQQAREMLAALGLELEVVETRFSSEQSGVSAQGPEASAAVPTGTTVKVDLYVLPTCAAEEVLIPDGFVSAIVLMQCGSSEYPDISHQVTRAVPAGNDIIAATLSALLSGPTEAERSAGFSSFFDPESANALSSLTRDGGRVVVDFNDAILINNASTSTGSMFFLAEIEANLFQFNEVDSVEFQLNGSCDAFWNWLQRDCTTSTRADWESAVTSWQEASQQVTVAGEIRPDFVSASAVLGDPFVAENLIDGDLNTTWQAGSAQQLVIEFRWDRPVQIDHIAIFNLSDEIRYLRNHRIQGYMFEADDVPVAVRGLLDDEPGGPLRIDIASTQTRVFTLEILSTYAGEAVADGPAFEELAIAEVRFIGSPTP